MLDNLKPWIDLTQALAVVATCLAVIAAVRVWRRQQAGRSHFELAEQTLAAFFEVKDVIAAIRSPFSSSDEGKSRQRSEHEAADEKQLLDRGYIVSERYEKNHTVFMRLQLLKYRCMAAFGAHLEPVFVACDQLAQEIYTAANRLATFYWPGHTRMDASEFAQHLDAMHKRQGLFWDRLNDSDEVRQRLRVLQDQLERIVKPHLRA